LFRYCPRACTGCELVSGPANAGREARRQVGDLPHRRTRVFRLSKIGSSMQRLLVCILSASAVLAAHRDPLAYVNPLIGTQKSRIGYGGTMPFVSPPFAMTNWTPQTRQNKISITSYAYEDAAITGFIGTHQPAIWMGDYGYITLMPQVGELRTAPES